MRFPFAQTIAVAKHIARERRRGTPHFPLVLMLEPLHACNLACEGCGRIREYKDYLDKMLNLDACLSAIDACNAPVVSICGGEPLIYPWISELVKKAIKRKRVVYLCTNGILLDRKLHLFEPHKYFNINVHIDGLETTHDKIVGKQGVFRKIIDGIKLAKDSGFTVCTNTTIYRESNPSEIEGLFKLLTQLKVDGLLISPSFEYNDVEDKSLFLSKEESQRKFGDILRFAGRYRLWSTPLFLEFCSGNREFNCTPWGNVTYNVAGWKAPCYLITDTHFKNYNDFIKGVNWDYYSNRLDERCINCMVHSGFEATVALGCYKNLKDLLRMTAWTLL